jgi:DNA invertase Pin-like site-specific DNA recombinase
MLIGYARKSTIGQDHALQMDALEQAGCDRIFIETASGTKADRPELAKALDYARDNQDQIVVWRLCRLARSLRQLIETVDDLQRRNIGLRSLTESIDTSSPSGRLVFHLFASLNQFEVELVRERTRAGLMASRLRGRVGGRPRSLGQDKLKIARSLMADPSLSVSEIAEQLGVATSTLYRSFPGGRGSATRIQQEA